MIQLCEHQKCTGCAACASVCGVKAIQMKADAEGFLYPVIDENRCVECGKCRLTCPQINTNPRPNMEKIVYAGWLKDKKLRKKSTSGGAFTAIAEEVLGEGGVVFGAGFDNDLKVIHKQVSSTANLDQLRGSKYVQSDLKQTFAEVKQQLLAGRQVLFSGTACQIDGLYSYLKNRYEGQLFTIDLVCHGVPSPKVWKDYLEYMETEYKASVEQAYFRNKEPGWYVFGMKLVFGDGKVYKANTYDDPYIRGFLRELFLRPSCHQCHYASVSRVADLTLADFWGYVETSRVDRDHDKGISMIMINSENGKRLFDRANTKLRLYERPVAQAVRGNPALSKCFPPAEKRADFWNDYHTTGFAGVVDKYLYPEPANRRYYPKLVKAHMEADWYYFCLLPNRILRRLLGSEHYERLKQKIRGRSE